MLSKLRKTLVCTLVLVCTAAHAATLNVGPGQTYTTIQSAINAAGTGDTVLVAPGTYFENIDFKGKAITVTSSGGATSTIIDGGSKGGVATVVFAKGETNASVISNFTIRGGGNTIFTGTSDGGVYVGGTSPTIRNNIITANYCHNIDVQFGAATILANEISGVLQDPNGTQGESYCTFGSAVHLGGGSYAGAFPSVIGNTIENNLMGSAINIWAAQNVLIRNNIIRNNISSDPGSAFTSANSGGTVLTQNLIYGNTSNCGGAIGFMDDGGLVSSGISILIANNTIVDNVTPKAMGGSECIAISQIYPGPYSYGEGSPNEIVINNIISGSTSYPAVNCSQFSTPSEADQPKFENNILYNGAGPFFGSFCIDVSNQYNNIVADPQFVSPSTGDYHLRSTSPAIDSGQNSVLMTLLTMSGGPLTTDFDGNPRVLDTRGKGCLIDMGAYEYPGTVSACSTTETLTSSLNPATYGQAVTFAAQLASTTGVPTGSVQFADGSTVLGTQTVSSTGASTFTTSSLAVGTHPITATYQPTGSFAAASASLSQVVTGYATTTTLTCSPNPIPVGNTALLTASVTSTNGTPTGSIAFTDNGTPLATNSLLSGTTTLTYTGLIPGTHTLTATYTPTGALAASSASCSETVTGLPTTSILTVSPTTTTFNQPVTLTATVAPTTPPGPSAPNGTVSFLDGSTIIGTGTLMPPGSGTTSTASLTLTTLTPGTHNLTCTYAASTPYLGSSCNTLPVNVAPIVPDLTLTAVPNPGYVGQVVTFNATIGSTSGGIASGNIVFLDAGTPIGSVALGTNGIVKFPISTLAMGTHPITATFAASGSFASAVSNTVQEVILGSDFTLALAPPAITLQAGQTTTVLVQLNSVGNFTGPLALTYGPLPTYATATLAPTTVTLTAGGGATAILTLNTARRAANTIPPRPGSRALPITFAAGLLLLISTRKRRNFARVLTLLLTAAALQTLTGCTNSWYELSLVAPGTYPLAITATDTASNAKSATLSITVVP